MNSDRIPEIVREAFHARPLPARLGELDTRTRTVVERAARDRGTDPQQYLDDVRASRAKDDADGANADEIVRTIRSR